MNQGSDAFVTIYTTIVTMIPVSDVIITIYTIVTITPVSDAIITIYTVVTMTKVSDAFVTTSTFLLEVFRLQLTLMTILH